MKTPRHIAIEDAAQLALTQMEQASRMFPNDLEWNAALDALRAAFALKETPAKVHVLTIDNDNGLSSSVHLAREGADMALYEYVKENWPKSAGDMPSDPYGAVFGYFAQEDMEDRAEIKEVEVED